MKAHELAKLLLSGPDMPVVINGWGSDEGLAFEVSGANAAVASFNGECDTRETPRNHLGYVAGRPCIVLEHCDRAPLTAEQELSITKRHEEMEKDRKALSDQAFMLKWAIIQPVNPGDFDNEREQ